MDELLKAPSSPSFITIIATMITLLVVAHFILILKFPESYKEPKENDKIANISFIMSLLILFGILCLFVWLISLTL